MKDIAEITLTIEQITYEKLTHDPQIILDGLNEISTISIIKDYILTNIEDNSGLPELKNFDLKNVTFDSHKNQGKFRLSFDIERLYSCSAITSNKTDYIDFDFHISNSTLYGTAHYFNWELNN